MNGIAVLLKTRRKLLGLSQVALAHASGVSLPTIQNIEAGRGNPCLQVLEPLMGAVGLRIEPRAQAVDWDLLAGLGLPVSQVMGSGVPPGAGERSQLLAVQLKLAALEIHGGPDEKGTVNAGEWERRREALQAVLFALESHFPTYYQNHFLKVPVVEALRPRGRARGRLIKLKRQALARLAEYL